MAAGMTAWGVRAAARWTLGTVGSWLSRLASCTRFKAAEVSPDAQVGKALASRASHRLALLFSVIATEIRRR
jgi:hypothetical protein